MESPSPTLPGPGQRSLAAIVFTDVVGFSARMQADEETTLELLRRDFDLMRAICTQHHGAVLKTTGDGLLLYFASAVQAVAFALAMQRALAEQAKGQARAAMLTHRVGIHLGDVFVNEQDVMGDGVNIAARLQAEAEPGGICISQTVYDVVCNKLALQVTRLGPRELKNISQSIPIYRLLLEAQAAEEPEPAPAPRKAETTAARASWRRPAAVGVLVVAAVAGLLWLRDWRRDRREAAQAGAEQQALTAMLSEEAPAEAATPGQIARVLADWRAELRQARSRALEEYNFAALAATLRRPGSAAPGGPEMRIRAQVLQRTQRLMGWMVVHLQRYSRDRPLAVRELAGTAPKEFGVFAGPDRRLYRVEGGAVRERHWTELDPSTLGAVVAAAVADAETLPPREVVQGALAFAALYHVPELTRALKEARAARVGRR